MTDLEQRLRRDLRQVAENFDPASVRSLRVPVRRRRPGLVRWLAPVMATAAVIGVIAGVRLATSPGPTPAVFQGPVSRAAVPGADRAEPAGPMPRYYVTVFQAYGGPRGTISTTAVVHDSASGAALVTVSVPTLSGMSGPSITAAADDRTFVITETAFDTNASQRQLSSGNLSGVKAWTVTRFYDLSVTADGRSATLRRLQVSLPATLTVDDVALSPDGSRLAVAAEGCLSSGRCDVTGIRIITLVTGAATSWTTRARGAVGDLSWAGGDHLAFGWWGGSPPGEPGSYRLLNVAGAGGNLLSAGAIASPAPSVAGGGYTPPELISPDGQVVITSVIRAIPDGDGRSTVVLRIVEGSAGTGRLLRVLYSVTMRGVSSTSPNGAGNVLFPESCNILSLGPAGVQPLVACPAFGRIENGKFKSLPGFPSPSSSGISGQQAAAW